jgi:hypothetical protein
MHDLAPPSPLPPSRFVRPLTAALSLGLAVALAALLPDTSSADRAVAPIAPSADGRVASIPEMSVAALADLRDSGPAALEGLLARYRSEALAPAERARLEATIDAVAAQRYATVSGLYWYTDLENAKRAARQLQRPILALRLLGDLRDDLSCANSRLFRTTLYANTELSAFLRSNYVLYWSSERPVPKVTIDFGDGRKLVRTTTGNSAHYVLDEDGRVLDVLPGLYAPKVFQRELEGSLALANQVRGMTDTSRLAATAAYHYAAAGASANAWDRVVRTQYIPGLRTLTDRGDVASAIARAQAATISKAMIEVPDLRAIGTVAPGEVPDDQAVWSAIGQKLWQIDRNTQVLDQPSRALIERLYRAGPADPRAGAAQLAAVIARLEQHIVADTALNQATLRQHIHHQIGARPETDFTALNAWIYDVLFATPKSDPWLGLHARQDFTGLPGDGAAMP